MQPVRPIAIYLPQFHPIPENDLWWGKGFTEWTNVVKAKPLFKGHYQPHLPADLGFYDLRVPEVREQQAQMAKDHGIYGFCYYHYWFNGRRILDRPFREVFESGKPDFPFMLCWANENWTRTWDGEHKNVLLEQHYSFEDDKKHIEALIPYFKDNRYIKVDGKAVIAIYKSALLPNVKETIRIWREVASSEGLELYICRFEDSFYFGEQWLDDAGFDAAIDFQPVSYLRRDYMRQELEKHRSGLAHKIMKKIGRTILKPVSLNTYNRLFNKTQQIIDYKGYAEYAAAQPFPGYKWYPGITPMWDNSARKNKYFLFKNSTPEFYKQWLISILKKFIPYSKEENFLFINAWNEWAEGNHLEPCKKWGDSYLEKTKEALSSLQAQQVSQPQKEELAGNADKFN